MYFQSNIKYLRKVLQISQKDFAAIFGKGASTIACWELGERTPTVNDTNRIAKYFNIALNDLLFTDLVSHPELLEYSKDEDELLATFRLLTADARQIVISVAKGLVK